MPRIGEILSRDGSDWESFAAPLPPNEIAEARELISLPFHQLLFDLYLECNGGEGSLPFQPWNFVLWGIEEVVELRAQEHYQKHYSHFVFFGGNGGGEYFGLD